MLSSRPYAIHALVLALFCVIPTAPLPAAAPTPKPAAAPATRPAAAEPAVLKAPSIVEAVAFSPDGKTLATTVGDNTVLLWDVAMRKPRAVLRQERRPHALAFSPDGKTLATAAGDNFVRLWDVAAGKETRALEHNLVDSNAVAFLPGGKTLAAGAGRNVQFWDVATGTQTRQLEEHRAGIVTVVAVSPDGGTLATLAFGPDASEVRLWDARTGKPRPPPQGVDLDEVLRVAISPDGKRLIALGHRFDKTKKEPLPVIAESLVRVWNLGAPNKPALSFSVAKGSAYVMALSPDGRHLAFPLNEEDAVVVVDASTGRRVKTLKGHEHQVDALAFSPDGRTLATGSHDQTIRLWDVSDLR